MTSPRLLLKWWTGHLLVISTDDMFQEWMWNTTFLGRHLLRLLSFSTGTDAYPPEASSSACHKRSRVGIPAIYRLYRYCLLLFLCDFIKHWVPSEYDWIWAITSITWPAKAAPLGSLANLRFAKQKARADARWGPNRSTMINTCSTLILTLVFQMRQGWFGTCCAAGGSKTTFGLQQFILAEGALFGAEGALFASTAKTSASLMHFFELSWNK